MSEEIKNEKELEEETEQDSKEPTKKEKKKAQKEYEAAKAECKALSKKLDEVSAQRDEINDKYLRMLAEFDNFKKRTVKESEGIYFSACADVIKELLPVFDNLQRAVDYASDEESKNGLVMIINGFLSALEKLGVEQYGARGDVFDAQIHNAMMRCDDEELGEGVIAEVFQTGYKKGDKVIRYAAVKVAN